MRTWSRAVPARVRQVVAEQRGAAVVEFAIIFPLLIILIFGMVDFGRGFFLRNNLVAAAREGARLGATSSAACPSAATIRTRVRNYVASFSTGTITDAQIQVAFLFPDSTASACTSTTQPTNVRVRILNYPFTPITPVFRLIGNANTMNITVTALYRWEYSAVP